jgi:hypothetical protein
MGRPPGRLQTHTVQMRVSDDFLRALDAWRLKQKPQLSRSQAIRRLVEKGVAKK